MDSLNLLIENGADLSKRNNDGLTAYDEMIRQDNLDIYKCVYDQAKMVKRNMKEVMIEINCIGRTFFTVTFSGRKRWYKVFEISIRVR